MTGQVLTSWKEIAAYLGKGVRTVQRWETEMGLPVRRPGPERHIVIAFPAELEEWLRRGHVGEIAAKKNGSAIDRLTGTLAKHRIAHQELARLRGLMRQMRDQLIVNRQITMTLAANCERHLKKEETHKLRQSS